MADNPTPTPQQSGDAELKEILDPWPARWLSNSGANDKALGEIYAALIAWRDAAIAQAKREARENLIEQIDGYFKPATGTRGQGGLPRPGEVIDWERKITKAGWEAFKALALQFNQGEK